MEASSSGSASAVGSSNSFGCNTCHVVFDTSVLQRSHMKEPWHVYNLKRRMTSLPSVSAEVYAERVQSAAPGNTSESGSEDDEAPSVGQREGKGEPKEEDFQPTRCLFCNRASETVSLNAEHMSNKHGLFIPQSEQLIDLETFIRYLGTIIWAFHECIYCATSRDSRSGIQQHMQAKGHCMLNFDKEPNLIEFWDLSDSEDEEKSHEAGEGSGGVRSKSKAKAQSISTTELLLPSGRVVSSRSNPQASQRQSFTTRRDAKAKAKELTHGEEASESDSAPQEENTATATPSRDQRLIAQRHQMGIVGISDQQKRALMVTEKKMQKQEAVTRAAQRWATEKVANKQKFYRASIFEAVLNSTDEGQAAGPMRPNG